MLLDNKQSLALTQTAMHMRGWLGGKGHMPNPKTSNRPHAYEKVLCLTPLAAGLAVVHA